MRPSHILPRRAAALALAAAFALRAAPPAARAAPADIARAPDVSFAPCDSSGGGPDHCVVRAFGDFNGDRVTDIVIERVFFSDDIGPMRERNFDLLMGPFRDGKGPAKRVEVQMEHEFDGEVDLAVADVNGDGYDDLALTSVFHILDGPVVIGSRRTAFVMGARTLTMRYRLGALDARANALAWKVAAEGADDLAKAMLPLASTAFGDVNGDGHTDMVIGTGADPSATEPARFGAADAGAAGRATSVAVMFGTGDWSKVKLFRPDVEIPALGACAEALAGVADVSGDGVDDVVYRRCASTSLPPRLAVLPGAPALAAAATAIDARRLWPSIGRVDAAPGLRMPDIVAALNAVATETAADTATTTTADTEVPRPPDPPPGRGYLPSLPPEEATPLFFEDVDADGVRDIVLGFGPNAHVWRGGPDIAARVAALRTDRVIVGAGFGALAGTGGWHAADLDGNGDRDMLLVIDLSPSGFGRVLATEPAHGGRPAPVAPNHVVQVYKGARAALDVLDAELDEPDAVWHSKTSVLQGMADFDGDGITDLVFGRAPGAPLQVEISLGPLR